MESAGLGPAEASAWVALACYNSSLRHALPEDGRPASGTDGGNERDEPDGADLRDLAGAVGPHHAFETFSTFGLVLPPLGPAGRSSPVSAMMPHRSPDEDAPGAMGEGDDGFDRFVREHRALLVAYLSRRIGEDDAQDVAQEALVRLMRYRAQPFEQLRPLMYRIAINVIHDRGRRDTTRQVFAHVSLDQDFVGLPSLEPSHDQRIEHEQELALVRSAILQLPERCRQVYLLNRIDGMSYSQIAQHCGISVKAVEKHIGKALSLLRSRLKQVSADREGRS